MYFILTQNPQNHFSTNTNHANLTKDYNGNEGRAMVRPNGPEPHAESAESMNFHLPTRFNFSEKVETFATFADSRKMPLCHRYLEFSIFGNSLGY